MSPTLNVLVVVVSLVDLLNAQCGTADHANCVHWVRNGFCTNAAYTTAHRQQYCPKSCPNLCGSSPGTVSPPTAPGNGQCGSSDHPNCLSWKNNGFCTNSGYPVSTIRQYCPNACPNVGCGGGTPTVPTAPSGGCAAADHPNCPVWVPNGFCDRNGYPIATVRQFCPRACANSGCGVPPTTTGDGNANCQKWQNTNVFCAMASAEQRKLFCSKTCAAEITAADSCALYARKGSQVVRTALQPGAPTQTGATSAEPILYVYAKYGCTAILFNAAQPTIPADPTETVKAYKGSVNEYNKIEVASEKEALSVQCSCP